MFCKAHYSVFVFVIPILTTGGSSPVFMTWQLVGKRFRHDNLFLVPNFFLICESVKIYFFPEEKAKISHEWKTEWKEKSKMSRQLVWNQVNFFFPGFFFHLWKRVKNLFCSFVEKVWKVQKKRFYDKLFCVKKKMFLGKCFFFMYEAKWRKKLGSRNNFFLRLICFSYTHFAYSSLVFMTGGLAGFLDFVKIIFPGVFFSWRKKQNFHAWNSMKNKFSSRLFFPQNFLFMYKTTF